MIAIGVDIGGTTVKLSAMDLADGGRVIVLRRSSIPYSAPGPDRLASEIRSLIESLPTPDRVGLGLPGLFDPLRRSLTASVNLPGMVDVNLDDLLRGAAPSWPKAVIVPDAHAAAFDLQQSRSIRNRLLAVSLGTGVGACVLDDGVPLRVSPPNAGFSSGHLGQIDISMALTDSEPIPAAPDGSRGTAEAYLGASVLHARLGVPAGADLPPLAPDDRAVRALIRLLRIAHAVYRPDVVALLGGVSFAVAHLDAELRSRVSDGLTSVARPDWRLTFAEDGYHASRGAARLAAIASPTD